MLYLCHVCERVIQPGEDGRIQFEGVTEQPRGKAWVWGPVAVHDDCRLDLVTPYDERIGEKYQLTWERIATDVAG